MYICTYLRLGTEIQKCVCVCVCFQMRLAFGYGCVPTMLDRSCFWPTSAFGHGARKAAPWSVVPLRQEAAVGLEDPRASRKVVGM